MENTKEELESSYSRLEFTLNDKKLSLNDKLAYVNSEINLLDGSLNDIDNKMTELSFQHRNIKDQFYKVIGIRSKLEQEKFRRTTARKLNKLKGQDVIVIYKYILDNDDETIGLIENPDQFEEKENLAPNVIIYKFKFKRYRTKINKDTNELNVFLFSDKLITYSYYRSAFGEITYECNKTVCIDDPLEINDKYVIYSLDKCPQKFLDIIKEIKSK